MKRSNYYLRLLGLITAVFVCSFVTYSQNLQYSYDASGNNVLRSVATSRATAISSTIASSNLTSRGDNAIQNVAITTDGDTVVSYCCPAIPIGAAINPGIALDKASGAGPYQNTVLPSRIKSRGVDTSKDVGQIPFIENVTATGAKVISVPIYTASAPSAAAVPQITLTYNSQAGNGAAGYGWSIGGLSSIIVTDKNVHYDGTAAAPDLSQPSSCVFSLDGKRLVPNTGGSPSGFQYVTAQGYTFVKKVTTSGGVVKYFEALLPDGSVATYGYTDNTSMKYCYPLTSLVNMQGYRIDFTYGYYGNIYYIKNISYGSKNASSQPCTLEFSYDSRSDYAIVYYAGVDLHNTSLLTRIVSKNNGTALRTYDLTHKMAATKCQLTQIDCSTTGGSLNPLRFTYDSDTPTLDELTSSQCSILLSGFSPSVQNQISYIRGKFMPGIYSDGMIALPNGNSTYAMLEEIHPQTGDPSYIYGSRISASQPILIVPAITDVATVTRTITAGSGFQYINAADVDGDGLDEVVKVNYGTPGSSSTPYTITVYGLATGQVVTQSSISVTLPGTVGSGSRKSPVSRSFYVGDFKGNGKCQLLAVSHSNQTGSSITSIFSLIDLENGSLMYNSSLFNMLTTDERYVHVYDFDGDGESEICSATSNGYSVYGFNGSSFVLKRSISNVNTYAFSNKVLFGDVNGDGKLDILQVPAAGSGSLWHIYVNTGEGFVPYWYNITSVGQGDDLQMVDMNHDGLSDLMLLNNGNLYLYLSNNGTISSSPVIAIGGSGSDISTMLPVNLVNYYETSGLVLIRGFNIYTVDYSHNVTRENLLTRLEDSYGNRHDVSYANIVSNGAGLNSTNFSQITYPYAGMIFPLWVTVQAYTSMPSGSVTTSHNNYSYSIPVVNRQGLGFCGFMRSVDTDIQRQASTAYTYSPQMLGVMTSAISKFGRQSNTYSLVTSANGQANPRLTQAVVKDSLTGIINTASYTYDTYGNPTIISESNSAQTSVTSCTYYSQLSTTRFIAGQMTGKSVTVTRGSQSLITREVYTYDTGRLPSAVEVYNSSNNTLKRGKTSWSYDAAGNMTSESSLPYNVTTANTTAYTYDSQGRLTSMTNPLGQTTTYGNFDSYGNPRTVTNFKGQNTYIQYDKWGNKTSVTNPDGTEQLIAHNWGGPGLFYIAQSSTGQPDFRTYYDAAGRQIRSSNKRFNDVWQNVDTQYDNSTGNVSKVSLPYRSSTPEYWNVYTYDQYGRIVSITEASGKASTWSYNGLSTTATEDSISVTRTIDASGAVVSASDAGGIITYTYRPDGQVATITAPGNVITSYSYDGFGRLTGVSDPSEGATSISESYTSAGVKTVTTTDARGLTVTATSDRYGRPTSVSRPEFSTTYSYNTDNLLSSVTSTNSTSRQYTYDAYGRLSTLRDNAPDGIYLTQSYTYSGGNVSAVAYACQSGNIATESYTYVNGYNTSVAVSGVGTIWQLNAENDLGLPTSVTTGQIARTYSYDAYGMETGRAAGSLQNFSYSWNAATGNLTSRRDNSRNITESFTYDALGRLTSAGGSATTYQSNGNISTMGGVGSYTYGTSAKPYQVTKVQLSGSNAGMHQRQLTFSSFQRPLTISENQNDATFTYNADGNRMKMRIAGAGDSLVRYYIDDIYEKDQPSGTERLYLGGTAYTAPAVMVKEGGSWKSYYICRDYQGSITCIANANGTLKAEYSYDAWGRLRNPSTHAIYQPGTAPELFLGRGYTGHEYLGAFDLVNMNARIYDPFIGRFISPDPYMQASDFTQGLNRYTYCLNNPLKYSDPSGEFVITATMITTAAIITSGAFGAYQGYKLATAAGATGWNMAGYIAAGGFIGGLSAVAGIGGGMLAQTAIGGLSGFLGGAAISAAGGMASGMVNGAGFAWLGGGTTKDVLLGGLKSGFIGAGLGGAIGGISGGISAAGNNKNFWNGKDIPDIARPIDPALNITSQEEFDQVINSDIEKSISAYRKGQEGVAVAEEIIKQQGFTDIQREVTFSVEGTRVRADLVAKKGNTFYIFEVKNGPYARFTPNQRIVYPKLITTHPDIIPAPGIGVSTFGSSPITNYEFILFRFSF